MTTDEKDALLGSLMREKSEAARELACYKARAKKMDRQFVLARAVLSQRMRLVVTEEDDIQVGYWDNDERESLMLPPTEELSRLVKEIRNLEAVIEERTKQISEIAP